jgi:hypothetical protein
VLFFKDFHSQKPPAIWLESEKPALAFAPTVAPAPGLPMSADASEQDDSLPQISKKELQRKAQQAFVPKNSPAMEDEKSWPSRNPFSMQQELGFIRSNSKELPPSKKEQSTPMDLLEPGCVFSGTLIDQQSRFALINGFPLSIGARIGAWQLSRIEFDYIILQLGESIRRIELSAGRQAARKEPQ